MPHVFVSYSHHDRRWVERDNPHNLIPFLADSLRRESVEIWYDHALIPGDRFRAEIESQIDRADLAILLVSQHFLNSPFIRDVELTRIEARAEAGQLLVLPILVGYCEWQELTLVGSRHMLPGGPTPLIEFVNKDAAWQRVQQEILQALKKQLDRARRRAPPEPVPARAAPLPSPQVPPRHRRRRAVFAAVLLLGAVVLAAVTFRADLWSPSRDSARDAGSVDPPAGTRTPLTGDETAALVQQVAGYTDQIRGLPLAIVGLQSDLKTVAERLWNERSYGPEATRPVASAFRLYAASLLLSPEGAGHRGIENAIPWLRRSLQLDAGFQDRQALEAASQFLMDVLIKQPPEVNMKLLLGHEIRIALIEASQSDVDAQVEAALEMITTLIRQREGSEPRR